MRANVGKWLVVSLIVFGLSRASVAAEDGKALPTLLIKGEIVSVDASDPGALLMKVKDRYGFETPIFLQQDTKVSQGDASLSPSNLAAGTPVEVEYNFDVNTAKRHAVTVKVTPAAAEAAAPAAAAPAVSSDPSTPVAPITPSAPGAEGTDAPASQEPAESVDEVPPSAQ
jgi:hypothetical protein